MHPDATILVLNCGSSGVKAAWFRADATLKLIGSGAVENVGSTQARFWAKPAGGEPVRDEALEAVDHEGAIDLLLTHVETWESTEAVAVVGHRVVHGGTDFDHPCLVDDHLLDRLPAIDSQRL